MNTPPSLSAKDAAVVWHHGHMVAIVTPRRAWIISSITKRPPGDTTLAIVNAKCAEALAHLRGQRPGTYDDTAANARAIARVLSPRTPRRGDLNTRRRPAPPPSR